MMSSASTRSSASLSATDSTFSGAVCRRTIWIASLMGIMVESLKAKAVALQTLKSNRLKVAEPTGFEPATSDVTGRRSNQLNYDSALNYFKFQI